MDYSLVVGVAEQKPDRAFPRGSDEHQPCVLATATPTNLFRSRAQRVRVAYLMPFSELLDETLKCQPSHANRNRYVARIQGRTGEVHTVAYYIGIIDFLQEWTPTKISA